MIKQLLVVCFFLCSFSLHLAASSNVNAGTSKLYRGTAYTTWLSQDATGLSHVWVTWGTVGSDPSTWTTQEITIMTSGPSNNTIPNLYSDPGSGHVFALWQFFDSDLNIMRVAAAVLPYGASTWTSQAISDVTTEASGYGDNYGAVDIDGNILATWTAFNANTSTYVVRGALATISGTTVTWQPTFTISSS
jgi:hypothetical protein